MSNVLMYFVHLVGKAILASFITEVCLALGQIAIIFDIRCLRWVNSGKNYFDIKQPDAPRPVLVLGFWLVYLVSDFYGGFLVGMYIGEWLIFLGYKLIFRCFNCFCV